MKSSLTLAQRGSFKCLITATLCGVAWLYLSAPEQSLAAQAAARPLRQYIIKAWTTDDGLPIDKVQAIAQTPDGYLWIGTEGGIVRFDGVHFKPLAPADATMLAGASCRALMTTPDGSLWIGTDKGVVARYFGGRTELYPSNATNDTSYIRALLHDRQATIWAGASGGLFKVEGRSLVHAAVEARGVYSLAESPTGDLWVGGNNGLFQVTAGGVRRYTRQDGLPAGRITSQVFMTNGDLLLGTTRGLATVRPDGRVTPTAGPENIGSTVRTMLMDRERRVWVGTWEGLARQTGDRFEVLTSKDGLSDPAINSLFEDRDGSIWVGTRGGGLNRLSVGYVATYTKADGLSANDVSFVLADRSGRVWIESGDAGVDLYDGVSWRRVTESPTLDKSGVNAIAEDADGSIWFGITQGLVRQTAGQFLPVELPGTRTNRGIYTLVASKDGGIWVGDGDKVFRFSKEKWATISLGLGENVRGVLAEGRDGQLWFSTGKGLYALKNGRAEQIWKLPSELHDPTSLVEDASGVLWVGTALAGLARIDHGTVSMLDRQNGGLPDNAIMSVVEGRPGELWLGTHRGIVRVTVQASAGRPPAIIFRVFGRAEGMRSTYVDDSGQPAGSRGPDGRIWFSTVHGVSVVNPNDFDPSEKPPIPLIDEVTAGGSPLNGETGLVPPGRGDLTFRFTAPSLRDPAGVRFRYRLDGYDDAWLDGSVAREARYTSLRPGPYRFRVSTGLAGEGWGQVEAAVTLMLRPHYYQTQAFYAGIGLSLVGLGAGGVWLRHRGARAREEELRRRVDQAMKEIKTLNDLLPICAWCKRIRDERGEWSVLEHYITEHTKAQFSHGLCPDCFKRDFPELMDNRPGGT